MRATLTHGENSMRSAILLMIGLMMGFLGSSFALDALRKQHAFPRGVMIVLGHHHKALKQELAKPVCDATRVQIQLDALALLGSDIDPAFGATADPVFTRYASDFRAAVERNRDADAQCQVLAERAKAIGDACNACHRDYR